MDLKGKIEGVLAQFKEVKALTPEILREVPYINLHAHSTYSLQDAVGQVHLHFEETIEKNHCGCCITDHGSYASFADLWMLGKKPTKKASKLLEQQGRAKHDVVFGAELYIFDDRHESLLKEAVKNNDKSSILNIVNKMKMNPKWASLFDVKQRKLSSNEVDEDENEDYKGNKIGTELIQGLLKGNDNISELVEAFIAKARRINSYKYNHITIHAKNYEGHRNLCELTSIGYLPNKYYTRPRIDLSDLLKRKEGLVVTSGCLVGMIPSAIDIGSGEEEELMELFISEFGDDFYIELHISDVSHDWSSSLKKHVPIGRNLQENVNNRLIELAKKFNISHKIFIAQDSHMPKASDKQIQDVLLINDKRNKSGWHFYNTYAVMSVEEMYQAVKQTYPNYSDEDFLNWCLNSIDILLKCRNVKINTDFKLKKPFYDAHHSVNPIIPSKEYLESNFEGTDRLVEEVRIKREFYGRVEDAINSPKVDKELTLNQVKKIEEAKKKLNSIFEEYKDYYYAQKAKRFYEKADPGTIAFCLGSLVNGRWDTSEKDLVEDFFFQLNTLQYNGIIPVSDYFLHFEDFAKVVMASGGITSPGRGSSAGCLLAYTTAITQILPRDYGLLFERFLLEERIGIYYMDHSALKIPVEKEGDYSAFDKIEEMLKGVEVEESLKKYFEDEMFYLERKPGVCHYLLKLKEVAEANGAPLANERNSTVCYLLGICEKPTKEIDKTDPAMPDIDFDSSCRDIIAEYLKKLHGVDHFAYICNYGSLRPISSLKEILRIVPLNNGSKVSPAEANFLTNEMGKVKISEEVASEGDLAVLHFIIENNSIVKGFFEQNTLILENLEKMLGTYKSHGVHAGGVILSEDPIWRDCPCFWDNKKEAWVTMLDKNHVEKIGFVKKDILGIKTLQVLADCIRRIKNDLGVDYSDPIKREHVLKNLPPEVFEALRKRRTDGIFQAGTPICQSMLGRIRIEETPSPVKLFSGITAVGRPGPMGQGAHISFIDSINGLTRPHYVHPLLEPILSETFGIIVYQEQVMKICQVLADFSLLESDNVRKAMGKKDFKLLAKFKDKFIDNSIKKGLNKDDAEELWEKLVKFAEYGFNKSHAVAYSAITCLSVYFSEKYPLQWRASLIDLASRENEKDDFALYYKLWKDVIKTPDISLSGQGYEIVNNNIQMPLYAIKGIGEDVSSQVNALKPFRSFKDFFLRTKFKTRSNTSFYEAVIFSGAIDSLMPSQKVIKEKLLNKDMSVLESLEELVDYSKFIHGKEEDLSTIYDFQDRIESGVRISQNDWEELEEAVNNLECLKCPITILLYRKFLWCKYLIDYKGLDLPSKIKEVVKQTDMTSDDLIQLHEGKAIALSKKYPDLLPVVLKIAVSHLGVKVKKATMDKILELGDWELRSIHPELLNIKKHGHSKLIPKSAFTKSSSGKSLVEAQKEVEACKSMNLKLLVLKQMEYLQFTTFDMSPIFEEEIAQIERDVQARVISPERADELGKQLDDLNSWATDYCYRLIKVPLLSEANDEDIVVRERYLAQFFEDSQQKLGWSYKKNALALIERGTNELDKKMCFRHNFARTFLKLFLKTSLPVGEDKFFVPITEILENSELKALARISSLSQSATEINSSKKMLLSMSSLIRFTLAKIINDNDDICSLIPKNKTLSLIAREIQKILESNTDASKAINAIKIPSEIVDLTKSVISIFTNGVSQEISNKIEEVKLEMSRLEISDDLKRFITDGVYVFGTVFREEKKKFLKERVYNNKERHEMNIYLNGETTSIPTTINNYKDINLYDISGARVDLVDKMQNYTPVILKVKGVIDGFTNSLKLQVVPRSESIKFIIDNIN